MQGKAVKPLKANTPHPAPGTADDAVLPPSPLTLRAPPPSSPLQQTCANCGTNKTPLWRKDKQSGETMCNACGIYKQTHGYARPVDKDCLGGDSAARGGVARVAPTRGAGGGAGGGGQRASPYRRAGSNSGPSSRASSPKRPAGPPPPPMMASWAAAPGQGAASAVPPATGLVTTPGSLMAVLNQMAAAEHRHEEEEAQKQQQQRASPRQEGAMQPHPAGEEAMQTAVSLQQWALHPTTLPEQPQQQQPQEHHGAAPLSLSLASPTSAHSQKLGSPHGSGSSPTGPHAALGPPPPHRSPVSSSHSLDALLGPSADKEQGGSRGGARRASEGYMPMDGRAQQMQLQALANLYENLGLQQQQQQQQAMALYESFGLQQQQAVMASLMANALSGSQVQNQGRGGAEAGSRGQEASGALPDFVGQQQAVRPGGAGGGPLGYGLGLSSSGWGSVGGQGGVAGGGLAAGLPHQQAKSLGLLQRMVVGYGVGAGGGDAGATHGGAAKGTARCDWVSEGGCVCGGVLLSWPCWVG